MFKYVFLGIIAATVYFVYFLEVEFTNQMIGKLFISGIGACFIVFGIFKFGLHYKIASVGRFATAFYYAVFEYKKVQTTPSDLEYVDSVRQQAEVALAANFDPTLSAHQMAIPVTLYSGKDPYLEELRVRIKEAEKLKLQSHQLDAKANILLDKTQEDLVEKNLVTGEKPKMFDRWFDMVEGTEA
ncbi:MAG: hypothetical protein EP300_07155, partial [Gammaproteobacteria bacterium]